MSQLHEYTARISLHANAYKRSQILFTAVEGEVFSLLETPNTAATVAEARSWSERGAAMLLDGLVALELLEKDGEHYKNTPAASECLVPGKTAYQGHIIRHTQNSYALWGELATCIRTGTGVKQGNHRKKEELRDFILGMSNIAFLSGPDMAGMVDLSGYRHVLDLACGPGTYAISFLQAYPDMQATLFDLPAVVDIATEQVQKAGLADRCHYIAGNCLKDDLGAGYDLILMSNIIHSFGPEENALVVKKCYDALEPGGTLIIKDFLTDKDHTGPAFSLIFALHMLVHTEKGGTYSQDEVAQWTRAAGFEDGECLNLTEKTRLWFAKKPATA